MLACLESVQKAIEALIAQKDQEIRVLETAQRLYQERIGVLTETIMRNAAFPYQWRPKNVPLEFNDWFKAQYLCSFDDWCSGHAGQSVRQMHVDFLRVSREYLTYLAR